MICPVCSTPVVTGARFCFNCGAAVDVAPEGERRVVTVLFGDLSDFTAWAEDLDPERVKVVTDRALAALAGAVQAYGGHVDKLTGDGIMAVFGAPTAHEDDAERAVRAADAMQRAVARAVAEETGGGRILGLRVGLNTGEVLAGTQASLSYTVVGDTVNTASRLSDAAGVGAILAGRETAVATMPIASWRALTPLRLKGKREPVPAYELVGLRPRAAGRPGLGDEAPLTGREPELGLLVSRLLDATERRTPQAVAVTGEAGIGKTRLARELARFAGALPGGRVLTGRCAPYGEARDYAPLAELVRTACGEDREQVVRTLTRLGLAALADPLLGLLGLAEESAAPPEGATPGDSRAPDVVDAPARLFNALAAEGPLLLVIDDLHWAGPALRGSLMDLYDRLAGPVLLVAVGRDEQGYGTKTRVRLTPLDEGAAERLLRAYLGGHDLDAEARRALLERAEGNPFFLAELLHLLVDRGVLRRSGSGWTLDGDPDVLPAGVQAVLAARIDSLDPASRATLRAAAVVGQRFWAEGLGRVSRSSAVASGPRAAGHGIEGHAPNPAGLDELVRREIVVPDREAYAFTHALIREVAYGAIPKVERARRHAEVAVWAAASMPGAPAEVDAFVSGHAERAVALAGEMRVPVPDDVRRLGFEALARLGEGALRRDENFVAAELLERALRLGESPGARIAYAEALSGVHRLDEALAVASGEVDSPDPSLRAAALAVVGDVRRKQNDGEGAVEAFVSSLACASEAGNDRLAGEALRQLGLLEHFAGRFAAARERFGQALEMAERVGDQRGAGWALQHLAWTATNLGRYDEAEAALGRASEVFASFGDIGGLGWCAGTEAFVRVLQGRFNDARALVRGLLPLATEAQDKWSVAALHAIDSIAAAERGEVSEAVEAAERAYGLYEELGDAWGRATALVARGNAARARGDHETAYRSFVEAVEASRERLPALQAMALIDLAWCHYDAGDLDGAQACAERMLELAEQTESAPHASTGMRALLALVARARGDLDTALSVLGEIVASPESPTLLFPMRQAVAHYAGTLLDAGRVDEALAAAERAQSVPAEDVRSRVIALRALGNARAAAGLAAPAESALREALALATSTEHRLEEPATRAAWERFVRRGSATAV